MSHSKSRWLCFSAALVFLSGVVVVGFPNLSSAANEKKAPLPTLSELGKKPGGCNNGHGNNIDGVDGSNPGKSKDGEDTDPSIDDEKKGNGNCGGSKS